MTPTGYPPISGYYSLQEHMYYALGQFPTPASTGADPRLAPFWEQVLRYVVIYEQVSHGLWPSLPGELGYAPVKTVEKVAQRAFYFKGDSEAVGLEDAEWVGDRWAQIRRELPDRSDLRRAYPETPPGSTVYCYAYNESVVVIPDIPEDLKASAYFWGLIPQVWAMAWGIFPVKSWHDAWGYDWTEIRPKVKKVDASAFSKSAAARFRVKTYDGRVEIPEFDLIPVGPKPEVPGRFDKLVLEYVRTGGVNSAVPDDLGELFCSTVGAIVELDPDAPQIMWLTIPGLEGMPDPLWVGPANRVPLRSFRSKVSWGSVINLNLAEPYDVDRAFEKAPWAKPLQNPKVYTPDTPYPEDGKIRARQKKTIQLYWKSKLQDLAQQLSQSAVPLEYLFDLDRYRRGVGQTSDQTYLLAWKLLGAEIEQHPFYPTVIRYNGEEVHALTDELREELHAILYPLADIERSYPRPATRDYLRDFTIRTCPICFRDIKVNEQYEMVDHGYHLGGTKYDAYRGRRDSCLGYRNPCWEHTREVTRELLLIPLEAQLASWRKYWAGLGARPVSSWPTFRWEVKHPTDKEKKVARSLAPGEPGYLDFMLQGLTKSYYNNMRTHWSTSGVFSTESLSWLRAAIRTWKPGPDNKPAVLAPRVTILPEDVHDAPTEEWFLTCRREIIQAYETATGKRYMPEEVEEISDKILKALSGGGGEESEE